MPAYSSMSVRAATPGSNHYREIAVSSVPMAVRSVHLNNRVKPLARKRIVKSSLGHYPPKIGSHVLCFAL